MTNDDRPTDEEVQSRLEGCLDQLYEKFKEESGGLDLGPTVRRLLDFTEEHRGQFWEIGASLRSYGSQRSYDPIFELYGKLHGSGGYGFSLDRFSRKP